MRCSEIKYLILFFCLISTGCRKFLKVEEPYGSIPSGEVFAGDLEANAAIAGIYSSMRGFYISSVSITVTTGLAGDELFNFFPNSELTEYGSNDIRPNNTLLPWATLYNIIYQANAAIEGLSVSTTTTEGLRDYYMGEAKFIRAFCYFNLVNIFGDVPLLLTTDVAANSSVARIDVFTVYQQIVKDLEEAELLMRNAIFSANDKTRVNEWSAKSFLARVHLYMKDWDNAEIKAQEVISSGRYRLLNDLDSFAIANNSESIWQFAENDINANGEASLFIFRGTPFIVLPDQFIELFEEGDLRRQYWIGSAEYAGQTIYYPFKYKSADVGDDELYTVLRLAEVFLISAEARAQQNKLEEAIDDINVIRNRAGLENISDDLSQNELLEVIANERRTELFAETGHRWFDLKRTEMIDVVLGEVKGNAWQPSDALYPIPEFDIKRNKNLKQNPGYIP